MRTLKKKKKKLLLKSFLLQERRRARKKMDLNEFAERFARISVMADYVRLEKLRTAYAADPSIKTLHEFKCTLREEYCSENCNGTCTFGHEPRSGEDCLRPMFYCNNGKTPIFVFSSSFFVQQ